MFKYLILTSCLVAVCRGFFNPASQIFTLHNGATINFQGLDLQGICRQAIMAMGGRPTDQLSDMMVTAVQNLQRIHGHNLAAITGKDPMWTCLASRAPGAMMANAVGDYFDTAVESLHRPINPFGYCNVGCGEAGINAAALGQNMQLFQGMLGGNKPTGQSQQTAPNTQGTPGTATTSGATRPASTNQATSPQFNPFGGGSNPLAMNPMYTMMQQMMGPSNPWAALMQGAGTGGNTPTATGPLTPTNPKATTTTNTGATTNTKPAPAPAPTMPNMGMPNMGMPNMGMPNMGSLMSQFNPLAAMGNPFGGAGAATPGANMQDFWRNAMVFGPDGLLQDGVTTDMGLGTAGASMARMSGMGLFPGMGMPGMGGMGAGTGSTAGSGSSGYPFAMPGMGHSIFG